MECLKCKKECLESELIDGICKECKTKTKNDIVLPIIISVIISVVLSLLIVAWANNDAKISDFKIESFNMNTETSSSSSDYEGIGKIICSDTNTDYIVLLEEINTTTKEIDYGYVIVHNGEGEFGTYDSTFLGATEKPEYEFNILGFRSFKK